MSTLLAASFATAIFVFAVFALAPRAEVVTAIDIAATPAEVWAVLGHPESYGEWNPFIVSMEGELVKGATLINRMRPSAGSEMTFRPTVLKADPGKELRWLGRLFLPRIFDGDHYFTLEDRGSATRLLHGEKFQGILLWFIDVRQFRADFENMNMALKSRLEGTADGGP